MTQSKFQNDRSDPSLISVDFAQSAISVIFTCAYGSCSPLILILATLDIGHGSLLLFKNYTTEYFTLNKHITIEGQ